MTPTSKRTTPLAAKVPGNVRRMLVQDFIRIATELLRLNN
jgi:hypothetical protein